MTTQVTTVLLSRFEFCHVQDNNTGTLVLHEGPKRIQLDSHEKLVGTWNKVRVRDGQFAAVLNPWSAEHDDILEGKREIRIGPCVFSLHPGEELEGRVQNEFVLTDDDALLVRAEKEVPHPLEPEVTIPAGTEILIKGPRRFIPHKDVTIKERRRSISLSEDQGVFVQNDDDGAVRLIQGPADFFLEHNESFWDKELTGEELEALGFVSQSGHGDSRVLTAAPRKRDHKHEAVVIELEDNEAICLFEGNKRRVEFGPKKIFLGAHERPKVLHISGDVPVRPNVLRIAKLNLGPDFIRDRLTVRTKDNATLDLEITFRWRFQIDQEHPEKLFALKDFVGFAAQTLSSEIREAAAQHDFEAFHSGAATIVKRAIFGEEAASRLFEANGLEIFGIDVEGITPDDPEIATKLTETIKTTVDIFTRRQQEEAELESERRLIEGRARNEKQRQELLQLEIENERQKIVEAAKTESEALKLKAQAEADAIRTRAEADAEAKRVVQEAEADVEQKRLQTKAEVLAGEGGEQIIALERARAFSSTDKLVVPTDSKLVLGLDRQFDD